MVVSMFSGVGAGARAADVARQQSDDLERGNNKYRNNLEMYESGQFASFMDARLLHAKAEQESVSTYPIVTLSTDMTRQLEALHQFSQKVEEEIVGELDANDPAVRVRKADELLSQLSNMLNAKGSNGEFLFSGASTSKAPIGDLTVSNIVGGQPTTNYYKSTNVPMEFEVASNRVRLSVSASHHGIRDLVTSLHMLKDHATYGDLGEVTQMAEGAAARIAQAKADIVEEGEYIKKVQEQLDEHVADLQGQMDGITQTSEGDLMKRHEASKLTAMQMRALANSMAQQVNLWDR